MLDQFWPLVSPLIARAVRRGTYADFNEVERGVFLGRHQLWIVWDEQEILASGITSLEKMNGHMICLIVALAGRQMKRWFHLFGEIEQFARNEHCIAVRISGRRGWTRLLRDYRETRVMLEKAL